VTIDFTRKRFWGLYRISEHLEGVTNAALGTNLIRRTGSRYFLASSVFIETDTDATRLVAGSSNIDRDIKVDAVHSINDFIGDQEDSLLVKSIKINNIFGWFGFPFLVLGVLGLFGWPSSIIRHLKNR
jgi:hypothetical protein